MGAVIRTVLGMSAIFAVLLFAVRGTPLGAAGEGEALFKSKCAACHGPDGAGQTPVGKNLKIADLRAEEVQKQSDADLTQAITKGKNKMPPFEKSLKPDEIKAVVAQVRELAKKK